MDPNRIALVRTKWTDTRNSGIRVGTAYLIDGQRLITARHVILDATKVDVRFVGKKEEWQTVTCEWQPDGAQAPDLAILKLTAARAGTAPVAIAPPPTDEVKWCGGGFATGQEEDEDGKDPKKRINADEVYQHMYTGLSGTYYPHGDGAGQLTVGVDHPIGKAHGWGGISGGPVFVGGCLVACIKNGKKIFDGNRVGAVPVLQSLPEEIRELFGPPDARARAIAEIDGCLSRNPDFCAALAIYFDENQRQPSTIAELMVNQLPLVETLSRIHDTLLLDEGIGDIRAARASARKVAEALLPARCREFPGNADAVAKHGAVKAPPGSGRGIIEFWMAALEESPADLILSGDSSEVRGRFELRPPPEIGLGQTKIISHLQQEMRALFPRHNVTVSGDAKDLVRDLGGMVRLQEITRSRNAKRGRPPRSPFFVSDDGKADEFRQYVDTLKKSVPNLWVWRSEVGDTDHDIHAITIALKFILDEGHKAGAIDGDTDQR
jgi:hypothetical protein